MPQISGKIMVVLSALILSLSLAPGVAQATSLSTVIDQVDQEYANDQMDANTHRDLSLTLQEAQSAVAGSDRYAAAVQAFNLLVAVYSGSSLNPDAASRIFTTAQGL